MKKILVYGLKNMWGGLEKYLLTMHEQLQDDVEFVYLMEQCESIHEARIAQMGGKTIFIAPKHPLKAHVQQLRDTLKAQRSQIDTLYVNVNSVTFDIAVILMGLHYKYRVIVHSHNAGMEYISHPLYRALHKVLEFFSLGLIKMLKITRLAVSDRAANYLFPGSAYHTIVPGVNIREFAFDPAIRQEIRSRLGLDGNTYVYGFVGRLESVKNPAFLLDVFHIITKQQDNCRLLMVGGGSLRESLEQQALQLGLGDKVIFVGETKNPSVYYQAMDHLLLPSQSEGLSMVAIEAQAAGLPFTGSSGRFPKTIALTPLINFAPLEGGAPAWANACIAHSNRFTQEDRAQWNLPLQESIFETKKTAQRLLEILLNA